MPRIPDLVSDSKLRTTFHDSATIHFFPEIDRAGRRSYRKEYWKCDKSLGRGGFGHVQLQRCITPGTKKNDLRAVKVIDKRSISNTSLDFARELEIIAKFSHDRYKHWFVKSFGWYDDLSSIFITMEYCRHGDLHHCLSSRRSLLAVEARELTYQILEGLHHMHTNDFAHRDLKPGNILIKSMPPEENWGLVLADFGISKRGDESNAPTTTIKGTDGFMAPELLGLPGLTRPKRISDFKAADMWALGEIAFRMLTSEITFESQYELIEYCQGRRTLPSSRLLLSTQHDGKEFVTSLMEIFPNDRMTTAECLEHRWMESQRIKLEEFAELDLGPNNPRESVRLDTVLKGSARWSALSAPGSEPAQTTAQWRPAHSLDWDQEGLKQTQFERMYGNPSTLQSPENGEESSLLRGAALKTLEGHEGEGPVFAVAFSPDGKMMASASGKAVRLWDSRSGTALKALKNHEGLINTMTFSPDGKALASASVETVRLWDSQLGAALKTLEGHQGWVQAVAFSPDGKILASASNDGTVRLWDGQSGATLKTLRGHKDWVQTVTFSPNGRTLASASDDGTVRLWDSRSGAALKTLEGHTEWLKAVTFWSDNKTLVLVLRDGSVRLCDSQSGTILKTLKGHNSRTNAVAFSPDGKALALALDNGTVRLWM